MLKARPTNRNIKEIRFPNLVSIFRIQIERDMTIENLSFPEVTNFLNFHLILLVQQI